tara:strand:- start:343 stop:495 length:153 start_codon:yes stop_codon:yes gene_type:complete
MAVNACYRLNNLTKKNKGEHSQKAYSIFVSPQNNKVIKNKSTISKFICNK